MRILATPIRHRRHLEVLALIVAAALVALGGGEQSGKRKNVVRPTVSKFNVRSSGEVIDTTIVGELPLLIDEFSGSSAATVTARNGCASLRKSRHQRAAPPNN